MPATFAGLPPFAPVSVRLLEMLSREDAVVEQVADLMRLDRGFVAEIMRLADWPVFGFQRQIRSLAHVVALLGVERVRAMASAVALKQSSDSHGEVCGYWRHNVRSALLAAELSGAPGPQCCTAEVLRGGVEMEESAEPTALAENAPIESLTEAVGLACRMSDALASPPLLSVEMPGAGSGPACCRIAGDPARIARVLEDYIHPINN